MCQWEEVPLSATESSFTLGMRLLLRYFFKVLNILGFIAEDGEPCSMLNGTEKNSL